MILKKQKHNSLATELSRSYSHARSLEITIGAITFYNANPNLLTIFTFVFSFDNDRHRHKCHFLFENLLLFFELLLPFLTKNTGSCEGYFMQPQYTLLNALKTTIQYACRHRGEFLSFLFIFEVILAATINVFGKENFRSFIIKIFRVYCVPFEKEISYPPTKQSCLSFAEH